MKLQSSLTRHQIELLKFANSQFEEAKNIKFAYADLHGSLKAMLNAPVRNNSILELKNLNGGNGNLEFSWWSWRGCLRGYLWTVNTLFYLFYSVFVICFFEASWFYWWFLAGERVRDWHSSLLFLRQGITLLPILWISFWLSESMIKQGANLWFFSTYKQNSAEWATICCSRYMSKMHINFYFCCALVDWIISYIKVTSDLAFLEVCAWNLLFIYIDLVTLVYWFILYILTYLLLSLFNYSYCY